MEYDKSKKHSCWIAFRFDNQTKQQNVSRSDEPLMLIRLLVHSTNVCKQILGNKVMIEGIFVLLPTDFIREVNEQTFYYTNMSPQRNKFNTGIWLTLEGQVQSWGRSCTSSDTLYVVKGGTIDKEDQIRGYISNDLSKPIPRYYYMALLFKKEIHSKRSLFGWSTPILRNRQTC